MKLSLALALLPLAANAFVAPQSGSARPSLVLNAAPAQRQTMGDVGDLGALGGAVLSARDARVNMPVNAALAGAALAGTGATAASPEAAVADAGAATFQTSLRQYFPGAIANSELAVDVVTALGKRGYKIGETLFGASLCSDEVNWTPQGLAPLLQQGLTRKVGGGTFNLGGLAGMPYVGTSGFGAFFSHCPKEGKVVIMFGPHVGISQDGTVGKLERIGMKKLSGACGAAIGAYKALLKEKAENAKIPMGNPLDNQEEYIIGQMSKKLGSESGLDSGSIATVTYRMYEIVWELMNGTLSETIKPGFWDDIQEVTLLGGIVINQGVTKSASQSDTLVEDYFQPVIFQSWVPKRGNFGFKIVNLYDEAFGEKNAAQNEIEAAAGVEAEMGIKDEE